MASRANTPATIYLDTKAAKGDCAADMGKIKTKCQPETEADKKGKLGNAKGKTAPLLGRLKLPSAPGTKGPASRWIGDHCEFLMVKPSSPEQMFKELQGIPGRMAESLGTQAMEAARDKAQQALQDAIEKKLAKTAAKQAVARVGSFLGGPWVGIAVNIGMTADGANDVIKAAEEFPELKRGYEEATKQIEQAQRKIKEAKDVLDHYKNKTPQELVSDVMYGAAELNDCIRSRRCKLVPFNKTETPANLGGEGCCPGQSGHHVLPSSMFGDCPTYNPDKAPTICVEGVNNTHGSHGVIHRKLGGKLGELMHLPGADGLPRQIPPGAPITKQQAIDAGAKSVQEAFPDSRCDSRCIEAQLHAFYDKLNCVPKNKSGLPARQKDTPSGNQGKP